MSTTAVDQALNDYLSVRRALGYKLVDHGRVLPDFVAYRQTVGASTVTTELALAWATRPLGRSPVRCAKRLAMVRGFARHLKAIDADTDVPPFGVLPYRCQRDAPYLYSEADIAALLAAARALPSKQRAATYETLIGLLAVTGMRSGEVIRLDREHIDWDEGIVLVWHSKFQKSRAIPVHPTTLDALRCDAELRERTVGIPVRLPSSRPPPARGSSLAPRAASFRSSCGPLASSSQDGVDRDPMT